MLQISSCRPYHPRYSLFLSSLFPSSVRVLTHTSSPSLPLSLPRLRLFSLGQSNSLHSVHVILAQRTSARNRRVCTGSGAQFSCLRGSQDRLLPPKVPPVVIGTAPGSAVSSASWSHVRIFHRCRRSGSVMLSPLGRQCQHGDTVHTVSLSHIPKASLFPRRAKREAGSPVHSVV